MSERDAEEQHRRVDAFAVMAAACDNLGDTGDQRDLYAIVDALVADLQIGKPSFACRAGCNFCCYSPPLVTSLEWRPIHRQLQTLPPEVLLRILDMARAQRPLARTLAAKRRAVLRPDMPNPPLRGIQCPMLVDGQCAVYRSRPMICRTYGYFAQSSTPEGAMAFFGCELALAHVEENMPRDLVVPRLDPYSDKVGQLHGGVGTQAYLSEWLWAHMSDDDRALSAEPILYPVFH